LEIEEIIKKHRRIMFDTVPLIYFIEEHKDFGTVIDKIFRLIKENIDYHSFSSVITLTEVLTQPFKKSRKDIVDKYRQFLLNSSNFIIYSITPTIAEKAAELRAKYGIKTPDAIQYAVGIENNATLFVTNDKKLKKLMEIEVLILEEYL